MLNEKYRPKSFDDVLGQSVTIEILKNVIKNEDFRPFLFIGNSGVGKTTVAKIFCKEINAEIFELDAATNGGVKDVQNIIQESKLQSLTSKYKIFMIDECHCLSNAAWSSFLLELEMKKKNVLYIFLTTEVHKIPETILSRLVTFQFHNISPQMIFDYLKEIAKKENILVEEASLAYIARVVKGNVRLALNYLEKCKLLDKKLTLEDVLELIKVKDAAYLEKFVYSKDIFFQIKCLDELILEGYDLEEFVGQCLNFLIRDNLTKNYTPLIDVYLNLKNEIKDEQFSKEIIVGRLWRENVAKWGK